MEQQKLPVPFCMGNTAVYVVYITCVFCEGVMVWRQLLACLGPAARMLKMLAAKGS